MSTQMHDFNQMGQFSSPLAQNGTNNFDCVQDQADVNLDSSPPVPEMVPDSFWDPTAAQFDQPITPVSDKRGPHPTVMKPAAGGPHLSIHNSMLMSPLKNYNQTYTTLSQCATPLRQYNNEGLQSELLNTSGFGFDDCQPDIRTQIGLGNTMPHLTSQQGQGYGASMMLQGQSNPGVPNQDHRQPARYSAQQMAYNHHGIMMAARQQQPLSTAQAFPTMRPQSNDLQYNMANMMNQPGTSYVYPNQTNMQTGLVRPQPGHGLVQSTPVAHPQHPDARWMNQAMGNPQAWAQPSNPMQSNQQPRTAHQFRNFVTNQRGPQHISNIAQNSSHPVHTPPPNKQTPGAIAWPVPPNIPINMYSPASYQAQPAYHQLVPQQAEYQSSYGMNASWAPPQNNNMMIPNAFVSQNDESWWQDGNNEFSNILEQQADIINESPENESYISSLDNGRANSMHPIQQFSKNNVKNITRQECVSSNSLTLPAYTTGLPVQPLRSIDQTKFHPRSQIHQQLQSHQPHHNAQAIAHSRADASNIQGHVKPHEHGSVESTTAQQATSQMVATESLQISSKTKSKSDKFTTLTKMDLKRDYWYEHERQSMGSAMTKPQNTLSGQSAPKGTKVTKSKPSVTQRKEADITQERSKMAQALHKQGGKRKRSTTGAEELKSNTKKQKRTASTATSHPSSKSNQKSAPQYHNSMANSVMAELNNLENERNQGARTKSTYYNTYGMNEQNANVTNQSVFEAHSDVTPITNKGGAPISGLPNDSNIAPQTNPVDSVYDPFMIESSKLKTFEDRQAATNRVLGDAFAANPTCMPSATYQRSNSIKSAESPKEHHDTSPSQIVVDAVADQPGNDANLAVIKTDVSPENNVATQWDDGYDPEQLILSGILNSPRPSPSELQPKPAAEKSIEVPTTGGAKMLINPSMDTTPNPLFDLFGDDDDNENDNLFAVNHDSFAVNDDHFALNDDFSFTDLLGSSDEPTDTHLETFEGEGGYQLVKRWGSGGDEFEF